MQELERLALLRDEAEEELVRSLKLNDEIHSIAENMDDYWKNQANHSA